MNNKILGLLAVGLMAGPISANAQSTTYTYQGDALDVTLNINPPAGSTSIDVLPLERRGVGTLSAFVTLSAPLGDNLNDFSVTPTRIQMFSGGLTSLDFLNTVAFWTNGNGAIDGWSMSLAAVVGGPGGWSQTMTSSDIGGVGGDYAAISTSCTAYFSFPNQPQSFSCGMTGSNKTPGVWTSPAAQAPEIDPASAASGLTLLLGGVAVLRGRRKLS
jgi:hypothetical protein